VKPLFLVSLVLFAVGVSMIFAFCNGTTGLTLGDSLTAASIHIDITSTGLPVLVGVPLTLLGALLLIVAWFLALFGGFRRHVVEAPPRRRDEPFRE
jgi:predicted membrane channel-forming protein YqfA (hemolysin III family)